MTDLQAKIQIKVLDGFSEPLRHLASALGNFSARTKKVSSVADLTGPIGRSSKAIAQMNGVASKAFAATLRGALGAQRGVGALGNSAGDTQRRFEALGSSAAGVQRVLDGFAHGDPLRGAAEGARRFERQFGNSMRRAGQSAQQFGQQTSHLRENLRSVADATIALGGLRSVFQGITGTFKAPVMEFASFDAALKVVQSKGDLAADSPELAKLKEQAEAVAKATKFTPIQVAGVQATQLAAGKTPQQTLQTVPVVLDMSIASAGETSPEEAGEILTAATSAFGLGADKARFAANAISAGADQSITSIGELGEALKYVGGSAARLKVSLPDTVGLLSLISDKGLRGSMAATALGGAFDALVAPSKVAENHLENVGIKAERLRQVQRDLSAGRVGDALRPFTELQERLAPEKFNETLSRVFGDQGGRAVSILLPDVHTGALDKRLGTIRTSIESDDLRKKVAIIDSSAEASIDRASGAITAFTTNLGSKFAPEIAKVTKLVGDAADKLSALTDEFPNLAKGTAIVGALAASLGTLWAAIGGGLSMLRGIGRVPPIPPVGPAAPSVVAPAASAAGGALGGVVAPLAVAGGAIAAGYAAHQSGLDKDVLRFFTEEGGFGKQVSELYKKHGLFGDNEALSGAVGSAVGPIADALAKHALVLPAIGAGLGHVADWMSDSSEDKTRSKPGTPTTSGAAPHASKARARDPAPGQPAESRSLVQSPTSGSEPGLRAIVGIPKIDMGALVGPDLARVSTPVAPAFPALSKRAEEPGARTSTAQLLFRSPMSPIVPSGPSIVPKQTEAPGSAAVNVDVDVAAQKAAATKRLEELTAEGHRLARQQIEATREQTRLLERQHRQQAEKSRFSPGVGPQLGGDF